MRLKYYLRGIGVGVIFATLLLSISFYFGRDNLHKKELTDEEIIAKAEELGMIMPEDQKILRILKIPKMNKRLNKKIMKLKLLKKRPILRLKILMKK